MSPPSGASRRPQRHSGASRRPHQPGGAAPDDRGSLPLAMLLTLVGVMLSGLLVPVVLAQVTSTRQATARTRATAAASAGLQVALGHLRATTTGVAGLPCGPLSGAVSTTGTARYLVTITYLPSDPLGKTDAWISANGLPCTAGTGPTGTPRYAYVVAIGTDLATGSLATVPTRRLRATYTIRLAQTASTGGAIRVYGGPQPDGLCLDAGSATPAAWTILRMRQCATGSAQQRFAYDSNLTLVLVSSVTAALPLGMCIDASALRIIGFPTWLVPCQASTAASQQWIFNSWGNFEGTTRGITLDGFCLAAQNPGVDGSPVVLGSVALSVCRRYSSTVTTFLPAPDVGSGAAGPDANQVVSIGQYSRCLEVTGDNINTAYLIAAPCQQQPDPVNVGWRQRWATPIMARGAGSASGVITTDPAVNRVCLRSPGMGGPGRYPTLAPCPAGTAQQNLTWTVSGDTGTYGTSYRITDGFGYCLAPTDPAATPPDLHQAAGSISKVIVTTCNGSTTQKWNAPPNFQTNESLTNIEER